MKKKIILIAGIALVLISAIVFWIMTAGFNSNFAKTITLNFTKYEEKVSETIDDSATVKELKGILKGKTNSNGQDSDFSEDISIELTNGKKTVVLYPALDGSPILRIDKSNKYVKISDSARRKIDLLFLNYGYRFSGN